MKTIHVKKLFLATLIAVSPFTAIHGNGAAISHAFYDRMIKGLKTSTTLPVPPNIIPSPPSATLPLPSPQNIVKASQEIKKFMLPSKTLFFCAAGTVVIGGGLYIYTKYRQEKAEQERLAAQEKARLEEERLASEEQARLEKEQKAQQQKEAERRAAQENQDRLEKERAQEAERKKAGEKAEQERLEKERLAQEKARLEEEQKEAEQRAAQEAHKKAAQEARKAKEEQEAQEKAEQERLAKEKQARLEKERLAQEQARLEEKARKAKEEKTEAERRAAQEKVEQERLAAEKQARLEEERKAQEQKEAEEHTAMQAFDTIINGIASATQQAIESVKIACSKAKQERLTKEEQARLEEERLAQEEACATQEAAEKALDAVNTARTDNQNQHTKKTQAALLQALETAKTCLTTHQITLQTYTKIFSENLSTCNTKLQTISPTKKLNNCLKNNDSSSYSSSYSSSDSDDESTQNDTEQAAKIQMAQTIKTHLPIIDKNIIDMESIDQKILDIQKEIATLTSDNII